MRFYEITIRVSEDIVIEHGEAREGDPVTEAHLRALAEDMGDEAKNVTGRFTDETVAEFVNASGPTLSRGGVIKGSSGPLADLERLQGRIADLQTEVRVKEHESDQFLNQLMDNAPRCWDGDEAMDWLVVKYVQALEASRAEGVTENAWAHHRGDCKGECES